MVNIQAYAQSFVNMSVAWAPKLIAALLVLFFGWWMVGMIVRFAGKTMKKQKVDESLIPFMKSLLKWSLMALLLITVAGMVGIQMTSFIAIIGAAGLAIGLALQGSLGNFAGGVLILIFKPFKVGDLIEGQGHMGVVKEIQIFNTLLTTLDNKRVIIPNGGLSNGSITNYTAEPIRRVDMVFGIGYDDDVKKAEKALLEIVKKVKKGLKDPKPMVRLSELADSSVNFTTRVWCKTEDYWDVYFSVHEAVKVDFDKKGIGIPFPQMDVHFKKD